MKKFEHFLSTFFTLSISLSLALILIGTYFYPQQAPTHIFLGQPQKINTLASLIKPALQGNGSALVELGAFLLILTPIFRVLFCHIFFLNKKYYTLAAFTVFTLILLILSSLGFIQIG